MMARATHSQLKKLKKLMTEKMSLEKAYSRVMRHCKQRGGGMSQEQDGLEDGGHGRWDMSAGADSTCALLL